MARAFVEGHPQDLGTICSLQVLHMTERQRPSHAPALHARRFFFLTRRRALRLPTPPQMHNKGNYVVSLRYIPSRCPAAATP